MNEATSSTRKVFVGIKVPVSLASLLQTFSETSPTGDGRMRWSDPDDLHITLKFIGEVPSSTIPHLIEKLNGVRCPRFEAEILDADVFQDAGVLVVDVNKSEELASLQDTIAEAFDDGETMPVSRSYRPHISLMRWVPAGPVHKIDLKALRNQLNQYCNELPIKSFYVDNFILYETISGHYRALAEFRLDA